MVMYVVHKSIYKVTTNVVSCTMHLTVRDIVIVRVVLRLLYGIVRLPEAGYHVSLNSNTLSPALCVGYATFTDRAPVSPLLVFAPSTTDC